MDIGFLPRNICKHILSFHILLGNTLEDFKRQKINSACSQTELLEAVSAVALVMLHLWLHEYL